MSAEVGRRSDAAFLLCVKITGFRFLNLVIFNKFFIVHAVIMLTFVVN